MQRMVWAFRTLILVVCVGDARAVDGVLEISQTCALAAGGCFPGDVAGYPVTIAQPGSYRLTSNLQVADANSTAIQVTGLNVTLDLGGFTISGPTVCGPGLPVATCNPTGSGVGILGGGVVTVRNGTVTGMGSDGINLTYAGRVEEMRLISNGGDGIHVQDSAFVRDVETSANGGDGIDVGIEAVLRSNLAFGNRSHGLRVLGGNVIDSVSSRNGSGANFGQLVAFHGNQFTANTGDQVAGGKATGGNVCSDHTCTHTGARRFCLSRNTANGAQALSACASGFHMASIWELHEPSSLVYDTELGIVNNDSGAGPQRLPREWPVKAGSGTVSRPSTTRTALPGRPPLRRILALQSTWIWSVPRHHPLRAPLRSLHGSTSASRRHAAT
jgi:hypothetical protein